MTRCSNCGTDNEPGRKFCRECGTRLAAGCPNCGTPNAPDAKFCGECGTALVTDGARPANVQAVSPVERAPVAERRVVSVLFADLVGFTPFAEERDAEETREALSRYFELAREVIARYGGTVEKFIGDAVMAVWGAPSATESDAERAVRAGLDLVGSVGSVGEGIQARAGVLTGEAAVTLGATNQGMVAGDLVNTAARLQAAAAPGTVLVGEATYRAAARAIAFEGAGEQALKGKSTPVRAWRAIRVVAEIGGRNRSETLEAPFVGRDEELRQLKDLFHATTRERRARLISVVGPAGIGKSRLAWEFLKYVDGLLEVVYWHDGRSPAYGEGITFWALGEMIRGRAGLLETDDQATTRAKIAATVADHVPDQDERRWIERALLVLLGVETGMSSEQLFPAWRTFFERLAATSPVAMVFEDLHWAEQGTLDFIDHLLEWSRTSPIYVLTLARPELLDRRPDWGAGKRNFTSLFLEPLPEASMRELLAGLVPGLPEEAVGQILARAEGVPLYAVETVRMLVAEGRLEQRGDRYAPVGDLTRLAVPETLSALIAARLDALAPADRALVQDASVLGQSFTVEALAAISGVGVADIEGRLRGLVRRELLRMETDPRSPERGQYAFVQALIREVAYNMLARQDRRTRHLAAARYFEQLGSDELAGGLAGQYLAAYANASHPDEADALAAQARIALRAAGQRARDLGAFEQAAGFLGQAISVTRDPREQADLHESAAEAWTGAGDRRTAEGHARRAVDLRRELGDREGLAHALALVASTLIEQFETDAAIGVLEEAGRELGDVGPARAEIAAQLGRALFLAGENERAIVVLDEALAIAERGRALALVADTLISKGSALMNLGRGIEGLALLEVGQRLAEREGLASVALRASLNRSFFLDARDPRQAFAVGTAGIELAERMGLQTHMDALLSNTAFAAIQIGNWSWADERVDAALARDSLRGPHRAFLIEVAAVVDVLRGRPEASARLEQAAELIAGSADAQLRSIVPNIAGYLAWARADDRAAIAAWRTDGPSAVEQGKFMAALAARAALWARDAPGAAEALTALADRNGEAEIVTRGTIGAGLAALDGDVTAALSGYRDALRRADDLGIEFEVALIGLDMAILLDPAQPEVQAAAGRARDILDRLGARPFVERLDRALARSGDGPSREAASPQLFEASSSPAISPSS
jgi:class 3 adenylate cyclase/tetratricopeptide (TPR) repeat protein